MVVYVVLFILEYYSLFNLFKRVFFNRYCGDVMVGILWWRFLIYVVCLLYYILIYMVLSS